MESERKRPNAFLREVGGYLRSHWKVIFLCCMIIGIFVGMSFLYNIQMEPILYSVFLCLGILIIVMIKDFISYHQRRQQLIWMRKKIKNEVSGFPEPKTDLEEQYQELLMILQKEKQHTISMMDCKYSEMVTYYSLWAHQIKTPIAALHLLLQVSKDQHKSEMEQELFKIEQYVEMVLGYLRVSGSTSDFVFQQYHLDEIVRQAIKKYAAVFIHSNIRLQMDEIDEKVLTDEKWLVFVIEQILSNSLKYTRPGGAIHIFMKKGIRQILIIEDCGIGISKEDLPRVFEEGYTGYNGHMDKRSTGIGLYLCKVIMTKLGHEISITSEIDRGTKVMLDLTRREF